ncbi:hypothetical protein BDQ12DRAFT_744814 [Crucibulum laeve]|uniref:NACHT domain-containing protein n=1 Tax=Crucibulum laeve TaxID=68775 RepID=A0A5C3LI67_9AGAR|nr:hypothetical protein BDQ12DRAFT_744814 [Crucibulum laeve]
MAFNRAKNSVFYGCNFNDTGGSRTRIHGIDYLRESIVACALYNSKERFDPPKCHAETRVAVLESIMAWVDHRQRTSSIMWLHGPAGAGKSAIAQTIAETCAKAKTLCAAFFFSRTASERNSVDRLLPTLVYQIVLAIPSLEKLVTDAIEKDFTIFSLSFPEQLQRLIVNPLREAVEQKLLAENSPQLIIIDGLDECAGSDIQKSILSEISNALTVFNIPLCFLISSRPEQAIRQAFNTSCAQKLTARLALDNSFDPEKDIDTFVRSKFNEIKQTHQFRSYPPGWPTDDAIQTLVDRSSGQFVYASVVMKYLETISLQIRRGQENIISMKKCSTVISHSALYNIIAITWIMVK